MSETRILFYSFIFLTTLVQAIPGRAQSQEKAYALMMINFLKGTQWPQTSGQFTIGVLEYPPLVTELSTITRNIKIGGKQVKVTSVNSDLDIEGCHMIFIPAYKSKVLESLVTKIGKEPKLIVTNKFDLISKGSDINFTLVDGKLRYELNTPNIESRGMKISTSIKGMAITSR